MEIAVSLISRERQLYYESSLVIQCRAGSVDGMSYSLCKLLVALGDHSTMYFASNITSSKPVHGTLSGTVYSRGHLVQKCLYLLLRYTGLPGYYGVDEEASEMTLGFWYLFQ
jgi:hypothetical protein